MTDGLVRNEQPIPANSRGLGRPFVKGDSRINRLGVPKEALAFQRHLRIALAEEL